MILLVERVVFSYFYYIATNKTALIPFELSTFSYLLSREQEFLDWKTQHFCVPSASETLRNKMVEIYLRWRWSNKAAVGMSWVKTPRQLSTLLSEQIAMGKRSFIVPTKLIPYNRCLNFRLLFELTATKKVRSYPSCKSWHLWSKNITTPVHNKNVLQIIGGSWVGTKKNCKNRT